MAPGRAVTGWRGFCLNNHYPKQVFAGNLSATLICEGQADMLWIIGFGIYLFLLTIAWLFIRGCSECEHRMSVQFDAIPPYPLLELSQIASFAELESEPYGSWHEETA